ncbi:hypothetical protein [Streptomyces sp. NPDC002520]
MRESWRFALHGSLREAGSARIVVVSSGAHRWASFDSTTHTSIGVPTNPGRPTSSPRPPTSCSTADVLFAVGARHWAVNGITANAVDPGFVLANLQRHLDGDTIVAFGVMDEDGNLTPLPHYKTPSRAKCPRNWWRAASPSPPR